jgi:hypothetical protein
MLGGTKSKRGAEAGYGRPGRHDGAVPTISRFLGITIAMFFDDHGFPHFHAPMPKAKPRYESTTSR